MASQGPGCTSEARKLGGSRLDKAEQPAILSEGWTFSCAIKWHIRIFSLGTADRHSNVFDDSDCVVFLTTGWDGTIHNQAGYCRQTMGPLKPTLPTPSSEEPYLMPWGGF